MTEHKNSKQNPLAIIILAAGKGTRMKSDKPKLMHEIAGLPMIKWLLRTAESLNPEKVIVVVGQDMPLLENACAPHDTAIQETQNGTGGAVMAAMPALGDFNGDVLILLGDCPLITRETLLNLITARHGSVLSVLGVRLDNPAGYGRLVQNQDGTLNSIIEEKDATEAQRVITLINTGAFCVDGKTLRDTLPRLTDTNAQKEFYITQLPELVAEDGGKTSVAMTHDAAEVQGVNTRAQLAEMEHTAQKRLRQKAMLDGVTMIDPNTVYLAHDTDIGENVLIEPNVFIGAGVRIESGAHIRAFSHIEGARIGKNAVIGPFARLRPETQIGEKVRIGNFVEIKKSSIGTGSKINHLAYVGDCTMGKDVNFSAGAITVNYDGFEKYQTVIGDGAMVGSDVSLVAPVEIGAGAFIAAGSTITESVPRDALAVSRVKAAIKPAWAAAYRARKMKKKS